MFVWSFENINATGTAGLEPGKARERIGQTNPANKVLPNKALPNEVSPNKVRQMKFRQMKKKVWANKTSLLEDKFDEAKFICGKDFGLLISYLFLIYDDEPRLLKSPQFKVKLRFLITI